MRGDSTVQARELIYKQGVGLVGGARNARLTKWYNRPVVGEFATFGDKRE